jgi:hypothetical protein
MWPRIKKTRGRVFDHRCKPSSRLRDTMLMARSARDGKGSWPQLAAFAVAHHHAPDVPAIRAGGPLGRAGTLPTWRYNLDASLLRDLWYWTAPRAFHYPLQSSGSCARLGLGNLQSNAYQSFRNLCCMPHSPEFRLGYRQFCSELSQALQARSFSSSPAIRLLQY